MYDQKQAIDRLYRRKIGGLGIKSVLRVLTDHEWGCTIETTLKNRDDLINCRAGS